MSCTISYIYFLPCCRQNLRAKYSRALNYFLLTSVTHVKPNRHEDLLIKYTLLAISMMTEGI